MGVKTCSRVDCENIMCDTCVNDIGYVCNDCQNEFKKYLEKENIVVETKKQIRSELENFMTIKKDTYTDSEQMSVEEFFSSYTNIN